MQTAAENHREIINWLHEHSQSESLKHFSSPSSQNDLGLVNKLSYIAQVILSY